MEVPDQRNWTGFELTFAHSVLELLRTGEPSWMGCRHWHCSVDTYRSGKILMLWDPSSCLVGFRFFHKPKETSKRQGHSINAQSCRFRVQIHYMHRICLWPVSMAVVSVVLFCKLLITSPFVHFCGPDRVLPSYFYYSCTTVRQKRFQQSSQLLLWFKVHGIVYSTAIYTTQLVFSDSNEWMILYSGWKRNYMVLYLSF